MSFFFCNFVLLVNFNMQRYEKKSGFQFSVFGFQKNVDQRIELLSHFGFFVAIIFSARFHELRNTFGESAMILFNLINDPNFFSTSAWLSVNWFQKLMTILAVKSNFSLSSVSIVFSASPMLFLYGVFLIVNYILKQKSSGIFLLLLLLGINQTFFTAVHTPLMSAATIYLVIAVFRLVWEKYNNALSPLVEMGIWAFACLFLFVRVPPIAHGDIADGMYSFSFISYFSSVAISTFVISFAMVAYLVLFWIYKKRLKPLILFSVWTVLMFALIFIFGRNGLLNIRFELLFFPLIAGFVGFFVLFFETEFQQSTFRFWVFLALVFLAIFGQSRTLQEFEKRQNYVVKLLQHTPNRACELNNVETVDKFALPEHLQQLERYIDPTHLAFETLLISEFRGLPVQSVFFIPQNTTVSHLPFSFSDYTISDTAFIKRTLFDTIVYDTIAITGDSVQFAFNFVLKFHRGDSISVSVWRKGSNFGRLLITDNVFRHTRLWMPEQDISEPDSAGWQKLSTSAIIDKTDWHKVYVWNEKYKNEEISFENIRVEIWRE